MKRAYQKPRLEVTEFRFSEHIAASGTQPICIWNNGINSTFAGCDKNQGTPYWTGLNG